MTNTQLAGIGAVIAIAILFGGYGLLFSQPGVVVNCDTKQIRGFGETSPPMMSAFQATYCSVEGSVETTDGQQICSFEGDILGTTQDVVRCKGIGNYEGVPARAKVTFFDPDTGEKIGEDEFQGEYFTG